MIDIMTIVPDDKDWTWVARLPCPECGIDMPSVPRVQFAALTRVKAVAWRELLKGLSDPRLRPAPDIWSAQEYGCHVRDVLALTDYRLGLMLTLDSPVYPSWDQDAAAASGRYGEQDVAAVAGALGEAAELVAARLDGLTADQWQRTGARDDGAHFTVESFARYNIHDQVHHLYDVTGIRQFFG
jgi:DinB superfamily